MKWVKNVLNQLSNNGIMINNNNFKMVLVGISMLENVHKVDDLQYYLAGEGKEMILSDAAKSLLFMLN